MIIRIANIGMVGAIADVAPVELPPEAWSYALNVRFDIDKAERCGGFEEIYNLTGSVTQQPLISPWFVMPVQTGPNYYWVYAGQNRVYAASPTSNGNDITRQSASYSATPSVRWNGAVIGDVPVLNNSIDPPQAWVGVGLTTRLQDLQWDQSASSGGLPTSWATRTAGAVTCKVFRTFREFGIAIGTEEGGSSYPRRLRWSHPTPAGTMPATWDETRDGFDAGYRDFNETGDYLVDSLQMRDVNMVYKEGSTWMMQYIGGVYVMGFRQVFSNIGMISHSCAAEFDGKHVVFGLSDIVLHDGQQAQSIIQKKWRDWLYNNISSEYKGNCFVAVDRPRKTILFCFPESGTTEPYWCTHALLWNWQSNAWSVQELGRISHIANGQIPFSTGGSSALIWDSMPTTWDAADSEWGDRAYQMTDHDLLMAYPEDSASSTPTPKLLRYNSGNLVNGSAYRAMLERQGLTLIGQDRFGNIKTDPTIFKFVKAIWPRVDANPGMTLNVYVGSQMHLTDSVTWVGPLKFVVGTDQRVNCRVMGRYISVRFETTGTDPWALLGYDIELDIAGRW